MEFPFDSNIILEDSRARLEPLSEVHVDLLEPVVVQNPGLLRYSPAVLNDRKDLIQYIQTHMGMRQDSIKYAFAVCDIDKDAYAGSSSFMHISERDDHLEIGSTWIGRRFQRTGLNRHMKFLMLQYAFETLGAIRVAFRVDDRNEQSKTAVLAIGATYEGTLRKHIRMADGFVRDTVCYSILVEEWPEIRQTVFAKIQAPSS